MYASWNNHQTGGEDEQPEQRMKEREVIDESQCRSKDNKRREGEM